jgi:hypothetical protein
VDKVTAWVLDHIHTPQAFIRRPDSWAEVTAYAQNNARIQTAPQWIRTASMLWCYTVVLGTYVTSGIRMYVRARFWRSVVVYGGGSIFIWHTPLGRWFGHTLKVVGLFLINLLP